MSHRCQIVIPARLASTRLPEKLLLRAAGKSVLQHTFDAASDATVAQGITIAVDDPRLSAECDSFGAPWVMTSKDCASGTDRIAEVARGMPEIDFFVNVQGDEPEINPVAIDAVASALIENTNADMATVGTPIRDVAVLNDPSCVKIVLASQSGEGRGREGEHVSPHRDAIYFSRAPVPHSRDPLTPKLLALEPPIHWHHLGLYAYRREFLQWFSTQPPSELEKIERLEQLRAIEAGKRIIVVRADSATPGIDTLEDFRAFERRVCGKR